MDLANEKLDLYNKNHGASGPGTLVGNWYEERVMRDTTGVGRTQPPGHIPKRHEHLFTKSPEEVAAISQGRTNDDTNSRVLGDKVDEKFTSTNLEYGRSKNKAEELPRSGKKFDLIERQFLRKIEDELKEKELAETAERNARYMETTHRKTYTEKDLMYNAVGRRVMRDQNGKAVLPENRDEDLLVDFGVLPRSTLTTNEELKARIANDNYVSSQPVTFWTEKLNSGNIYMSKASGPNPFAKNNGFLKTFTHYKHYKD